MFKLKESTRLPRSTALEAFFQCIIGMISAFIIGGTIVAAGLSAPVVIFMIILFIAFRFIEW